MDSGTSFSMTSVPMMKEYILTKKLGCGTYATVYKAYKKVNSVWLADLSINDLYINYVGNYTVHN